MIKRFFVTEDFKDHPNAILEWIENIKHISSDKAFIVGNMLFTYPRLSEFSKTTTKNE